MQSNLSRSPANRRATDLILARDTAFASMLAAIIALIVAVALDLTCIVPVLSGNVSYNPIRDFLSYQVDAQSGQLMTGVFLLLAVAAWSFAIAAFLAPNRPNIKILLGATFLFGAGLFIGACFRAVPKPELAAEPLMKINARLHDIGIGGGFVPAMLAAFMDQHKIVLGRVPGYFLTKLSFWLIVVGAVGTALAVLILHNVAGLMQRCYVLGLVLWLITEAHQLFWSSTEKHSDE